MKTNRVRRNSTTAAAARQPKAGANSNTPASASTPGGEAWLGMLHMEQAINEATALLYLMTEDYHNTAHQGDPSPEFRGSIGAGLVGLTGYVTSALSSAFDEASGHVSKLRHRTEKGGAR